MHKSLNRKTIFATSCLWPMFGLSRESVFGVMIRRRCCAFPEDLLICFHILVICSTIINISNKPINKHCILISQVYTIHFLVEAPPKSHRYRQPPQYYKEKISFLQRRHCRTSLNYMHELMFFPRSCQHCYQLI